MAAQPISGIVPAQLGFLAIYSPSLGTTDETLEDQIVYYASVNTQHQKRRRHRSRSRLADNVSHEERNERLRQIGLAQGMVEFSKSFSGGEPVDTIETEKSRVVLHELEPGWWILASIDLTRLPLPPPRAASSATNSATTQGKSADTGPEENVEYSSREVKPAALLLQDLLRAHAVFLLHHDSSLAALFSRSKRKKFTSILGRYWDLFLSTWNVLLHGNPARNVFGGIKIAASGELGVGVGEEERGSGEREVLEGLVGRIEGLVDLVVSKFGGDDAGLLSKDEEGKIKEAPKDGEEKPWLGTGNEPDSEDGAIFLGAGAVSRPSLRDITYWMEDLYTWGENAYGVLDSPTSLRRGRRAKPSSKVVTKLSKKDVLRDASSQLQSPSGEGSTAPKPTNEDQETGGLDKYMDYLKLGYGKYWSLGGSGADSGTEGQSSQGSGTPANTQQKEVSAATAVQSSRVDEVSGHFLIGLAGDIDKGDVDDAEDDATPVEEGGKEHNSRTMLRTLTVEVERKEPGGSESQVAVRTSSEGTKSAEDSLKPGNDSTADSHTAFDKRDSTKTKLRVVVYVNKPFIFTFLFELRTDSLAWDALYRSLHHQLSPVKKALTSSTAYRAERPEVGNIAAQIFDLVWDPRALTVYSTIPNIPDPAVFLLGSDRQPAWSRVEAINTHMHLLNTFAATRENSTELERTSKTSRGWWVVWSRILEREERLGTPIQGNGSEAADDGEGSAYDTSSSAGNEPAPTHGDYVVKKEIFLVRKASDHGGHSIRSVSMGGGGWTDGASRLAQGIGVDTRKYIEGLLSLNR